MSIFIFIIILLVLILAHEFGHFITAKIFHVRVDEFGVGLPPKVLRLFKKGETEYTLNVLPIGGFVRLYGEEQGAVIDDKDRDRAFVNRPGWMQAIILIAGVSFNILVAWLIYVSLFATGIPMSVDDTLIYNARDVRVVVTAVLPDSPAEAAGISVGDQLVSISSGNVIQEITRAEDVVGFIGTQEPQEVEIITKRGDAQQNISLHSQTGLVDGDPERSAIGVALSSVGLVSLPIHKAIIEGTKLTFSNLRAIVVAVGGLIVGALTLSADLSQIAGPVGIVGLVGDAASLGFIPILLFTAFISLNLAIINVIPFPALDGGRLLFVVIEAIKGSPIKPIISRTANTIGFALLIFLILIVTYNDILRLVG